MISKKLFLYSVFCTMSILALSSLAQEGYEEEGAGEKRKEESSGRQTGMIPPSHEGQGQQTDVPPTEETSGSTEVSTTGSTPELEQGDESQGPDEQGIKVVDVEEALEDPSQFEEIPLDEEEDLLKEDSEKIRPLLSFSFLEKSSPEEYAKLKELLNDFTSSMAHIFQLLTGVVVSVNDTLNRPTSELVAKTTAYLADILNLALERIEILRESDPRGTVNALATNVSQFIDVSNKVFSVLQEAGAHVTKAFARVTNLLGQTVALVKYLDFLRRLDVPLTIRTREELVKVVQAKVDAVKESAGLLLTRKEQNDLTNQINRLIDLEKAAERELARLSALKKHYAALSS